MLGVKGVSPQAGNFHKKIPDPTFRPDIPRSDQRSMTNAFTVFLSAASSAGSVLTSAQHQRDHGFEPIVLQHDPIALKTLGLSGASGTGRSDVDTRILHANLCTHPYDAHQQCGPDPDACTVVVCLAFGDCGYATRGCYDGNPCTDDACVQSIGCTYTDNSAPCDDGSGCTVNDACAGGACGGTTITPPPEIGHDRFSTRTIFVWDSVLNAVPGTTYDVARGLASDLPSGMGGNETCRASGLTGTSLDVPDLAPVGEAFWYLVRARNSCGDGTWGSWSNGFPRSMANCP